MKNKVRTSEGSPAPRERTRPTRRECGRPDSHICLGCCYTEEPLQQRRWRRRRALAPATVVVVVFGLLIAVCHSGPVFAPSKYVSLSGQRSAKKKTPRGRRPSSSGSRSSAHHTTHHRQRRPSPRHCCPPCPCCSASLLLMSVEEMSTLKPCSSRNSPAGGNPPHGRAVRAGVTELKPSPSARTRGGALVHGGSG